MGIRPEKIVRVFIALALGFAFAAVLGEVALRIAKLASASARPETPGALVRDQGDSSIITIVALGESTTSPARIEGREAAWPELLEIDLNRRFAGRTPRVSFRVRNLAKAATSSPFQVAQLEREAKQVRPEIVISMIGVNDAHVKNVSDSFLFERSYLVRWLYWARVSWNCSLCQELRLNPSADTLDPASSSARSAADEVVLKLSSLPFRTSSDVENFRSWLRERQKVDDETRHEINVRVVIRIFMISQRPGIKETALSRELLLAAKEILNSSYREKVLTQNSALEQYCHIRTQLQEAGCAAAMKEALQAGLPLTPQLMTIGAQEGAFKDDFLRELFRGAGFEMTSERSGGAILAESYRRLEAIVTNYDLVWLPMQYPTGSVGALEFYLSEDAVAQPLNFADSFKLARGRYKPRLDNVILISNERFKEQMGTAADGEYFRDFFARSQGLDFGHTTVKGSELIARNAADQIESSWKEIAARLERRAQKQR